MGTGDENVESLCWGTGEPIVDSIDGDRTAVSAAYRDSIVGKLIGGDDKYGGGGSGGSGGSALDDDAPEPLALLAIHAAMHMLFLPQFTCDFYEEGEGEDDGDDNSNSASDDSHSSGESRSRSRKGGSKEGFLDRVERRAREEEQAEKEDNIMKKEVGLKSNSRARYVASGILLQPKPAWIVWSKGCGVKSKNSVSCRLVMLYDMIRCAR